MAAPVEWRRARSGKWPIPQNGEQRVERLKTPGLATRDHLDHTRKPRRVAAIAPIDANDVGLIRRLCHRAPQVFRQSR